MVMTMCSLVLQNLWLRPEILTLQGIGVWPGFKQILPAGHDKHSDEPTEEYCNIQHISKSIREHWNIITRGTYHSNCHNLRKFCPTVIGKYFWNSSIYPFKINQNSVQKVYLQHFFLPSISSFYLNIFLIVQKWRTESKCKEEILLIFQIFKLFD